MEPLVVNKTTPLQALLIDNDFSQIQLAIKTGMSKAVVSHYVTGERPLTERAIRKIKLVFTNVNEDFLRGQSSQMYLESSEMPATSNAQPISVDYVKMLEKYLEDTISERNRLAEQNTRLVLTLERYGSRLEKQSETLEQTLGQIVEGLKERRRG